MHLCLPPRSSPGDGHKSHEGRHPCTGRKSRWPPPLQDADAMIRTQQGNRVKLGVIFQDPVHQKRGEAEGNDQPGGFRQNPRRPVHSHLETAPGIIIRAATGRAPGPHEGRRRAHRFRPSTASTGYDTCWAAMWNGLKEVSTTTTMIFVKVEDSADAAIQFENGCIYNLYACNIYAADSPIQIELIGEKGTLWPSPGDIGILRAGRLLYRDPQYLRDHQCGDRGLLGQQPSSAAAGFLRIHPA